MAKASDVIAVARKEVGYVEGKNNDTKYGKAYGMNNVYWCVQFPWWVCQQVDKRLFLDGGKSASCSEVMNWAKAHGQWVTKDYKQGDLLIFDFPNNKVKTDHMGICVSVSGTKVNTIEGNTSPSSGGNQSNGDGVYEKSRNISLVLGAYRPKYDKSFEDVLQERAGLSDATMKFLMSYKWHDALIEKLATMK